MSGAYAKLYRHIWGDPDFKALNAEEQLLYIKLFSQPDVSMAGVLTVATTRWATQTAGQTVERIEECLATLQDRGYVVVDHDTQEVLLRSYIRNDGGWVSNKTLTGVTNAVRRVLSPTLRSVISEELLRLDLGLVRDKPLQNGTVPRDVAEREIGYLVTENPPQDTPSEGVSDGVSDGVFRSCPPTNTNTNTNTNTHAHSLPTSNPQADTDVKKENERNDDPEITELCSYLADWIEANGSKRPTITKAWRNSCRLMLDRDGRTPQQVRAAIDWSQQDPFWKANILSMSSLRSKYDQLRLKAQAEQQRRAPTLSRAEEIYVAEKRRLAAVDAERRELSA